MSYARAAQIAQPCADDFRQHDTQARVSNDDCLLTVLIPCLDEAETLGACIRQALAYLDEAGVPGEVVVADNGGTDGSQDIATALGARVVPIAVRGYGGALAGGIEAARGRYVIMGDADDSYDLRRLGSFLAELQAGADLVMGNRFRGGIGTGAMPFLHRYPPGSWPLEMRAETATAYCDEPSVQAFMAKVDRGI